MTEFMAQLPVWVVCLMVLIAKVLEISIQSCKTMMLVKGERTKAVALGFAECMIWGLVISSIISTLGDNFFLLLFYCLGYATGMYIGSKLENKIALGTSRIEMIASEENTEKIKEFLKERNKGFTIIEGEGAKGKVNIIFIILQRKEVSKITKEISKLCDGQVFEITDDISRFKGGYGIGK